jgi:hypothetical protein
MSVTTTKPEHVAIAFTNAWNRHDMDEFASLFASDANFVNVVGVWWKNRSEIEAAHRATHETIFRNSRLEGDVLSVVELAPGACFRPLHLDPNGSICSGRVPGRRQEGHIASDCQRRAVGMAHQGGSEHGHFLARSPQPVRIANYADPTYRTEAPRRRDWKSTKASPSGPRPPEGREPFGHVFDHCLRNAPV